MMICTLGLLQAQDVLPMLFSGEYIEWDAESTEELQDLLDHYRSFPLVWNRCTIEELEELPVNVEFRERLLAIRRRGMAYRSWAHFQRDSGLSDRELEILRLFVVLREPVAFSSRFRTYSALQRGDEDLDLTKTVSRLAVQTGRGLSAGTIVERDAGEPHLGDYTNYYIQYRGSRDRLQLTTGAFRLQWGHGILGATSLFNSRNLNPLRNVKSGPSRIRPYNGVDENRFYRGLAAQYQGRQWRLLGIVSHNFIDAHTDSSGIHSLIRSGIHISAAQLENKQSVVEKTWGIGGIREQKYWQLGALLQGWGYSQPVHFLEGKSPFRNNSVWWAVQGQQWSLSGEAVWQSFGAVGIVGSATYRMEKIRLALAGRYYSPELFLPFGSPLRRYSGLPQNERGVHAGFYIQLPARFRWSLYADVYERIRAEDEGQPVPRGQELVSSLARNFGDGFQLDLRYRRRLDTRSGQQVREGCKQQCNLTLRYHYAELDWVLRSGYLQVGRSNLQSGTYVSLTASAALRSRGTVVAGLTHFYIRPATPVLYVYEPGIPMRFNLAALSGSGYHIFGSYHQRCSQRISSTIALKYQSRRKFSSAAQQRNIRAEIQLVVDL